MTILKIAKNTVFHGMSIFYNLSSLSILVGGGLTPPPLIGDMSPKKAPSLLMCYNC